MIGDQERRGRDRGVARVLPRQARHQRIGLVPSVFGAEYLDRRPGEHAGRGAGPPQQQHPGAVERSPGDHRPVPRRGDARQLEPGGDAGIPRLQCPTHVPLGRHEVAASAVGTSDPEQLVRRGRGELRDDEVGGQQRHWPGRVREQRVRPAPRHVVPAQHHLEARGIEQATAPEIHVERAAQIAGRDAAERDEVVRALLRARRLHPRHGRECQRGVGLRFGAVKREPVGKIGEGLRRAAPRRRRRVRQGQLLERHGQAHRGGGPERRLRPSQRRQPSIPGLRRRPPLLALVLTGCDGQQIGDRVRTAHSRQDLVHLRPLLETLGDPEPQQRVARA